MLQFKILDARVTPDHLGFIPEFLSEHDPRPAVEQIDANYQHGGGWRPIKGFMPLSDFHLLKYPGDPPLHALAVAELRDERIFIYEHAFVAVQHADGTFSTARID